MSKGQFWPLTEGHFNPAGNGAQLPSAPVLVWPGQSWRYAGLTRGVCWVKVQPVWLPRWLCGGPTSAGDTGLAAAQQAGGAGIGGKRRLHGNMDLY